MANSDLRTFGGQIGYEQAAFGQVELDSEGLMLKPGSEYHVRAVTPFAPKSSQGDPSYQNFEPFDSPASQANWTAGYGFIRASHNIGTDGWTGAYWSGYFEGENVDPAFPGRITLAPAITFETLPGLASSMTTARFAELGGTLLAAAGTALYWRNDVTGVWTAANGSAFGGTAWDLAPLGGTVFVGLGDAVNMKYTSDLSAFGTTAPARALTSDKVGLYRAFNTNQLQGSSTGTGWVAEPVITVGDSSSPITSLAPGGGLILLWAAKTDGLWAFPIGTGGTATKYLPFERRYSRNGKNLIWHGPQVLVPNGRGLWTFQVSSQNSGDAVNITPGRDAQQTGTVRGEVRALAESSRFIYAALVDPNATGGTALYINRQDTRTGRWHTWLSPGLGNCETLYLRATPTPAATPANPMLWFGFGNQVAHVTLPVNGDDPLADSNCRFSQASNVSITTSGFDFGLPDVPKSLQWIAFGAERLSGGQKYVAIDYQLDSSGTWKTDLNPNTAYTVPSTVMHFPTDTTCRWVQLRYRPVTTDPTDTPLIRYVVVHARVLVDNRWRWIFAVQLAQGQQMENMAQRTDLAFRIFRKVMRLRETQEMVIYKDREGYQWYVVVDEVDGSTVREPGASPEWSVALQLTQALPGLAAGISNAIETPTATNAAAVFDDETYLD